MPRSLTVATLGTLVLVALACGGGDQAKVPKPWVEREGQREVVGNPGNVDDVASGRAEAQEAQAPAERTTTIERVGPDAEGALPPVEDDYDDLATQDSITTCPEGTTLLDERASLHRQACVLPNGVRHGPYMLWHGNGVLKEVGPYVGGLRSGRVTTWDREGNKYSTYQWMDGSPVSGEVYK